MRAVHSFDAAMDSNDGKSLSGDDPPNSPSDDPLNSTTTMQSVGYSMHMYPFPSHVLPQQQPPRSKRRQVKNACTNCQKACKKCDDARPCLRCVKYGVSEECIDSQRKERKKGIKRGPYKKRDGKGVYHFAPFSSAVSTRRVTLAVSLILEIAQAAAASDKNRPRTNLQPQTVAHHRPAALRRSWARSYPFQGSMASTPRHT
ncbi:hypothetical protein C0991_000869 [Blastosporella zonata]|nr:hypothetical protein C0991_000869 [Blastosporella zonata]